MGKRKDCALAFPPITVLELAGVFKEALINSKMLIGEVIFLAARQKAQKY